MIPTVFHTRLLLDYHMNHGVDHAVRKRQDKRRVLFPLREAMKKKDTREEKKREVAGQETNQGITLFSPTAF